MKSELKLQIYKTAFLQLFSWKEAAVGFATSNDFKTTSPSATRHKMADLSCASFRC
jgi:hypothetical protein